MQFMSRMMHGRTILTKLKKSRKIVFVADYFRDKILGGAECNDSVLISHLESVGCEVDKVLSRELRPTDLVSNDAFFIVGNFVGLNPATMNAMAHGRIDYLIYEHDHKYLKSRDPSKFKKFKAPEDQIINRAFYENANAVVVLSEVCKEVIQKNLSIDNVYNIGCSLWDTERLDFLESLADTEKTKPIVILNSRNPTKGTDAAIGYCTKKNINYEMIWSENEKDFLSQLASAEKLVYIPQVLETFCRLTAEAKMLNCKLITKKKLLGFASEECFELEGKALIGDIRNRVDKALSLFEELLGIKEETVAGITAILTCYKRPHLLEEQIQALQGQSNPPEEIWVWVNDAPENEGIDFDYGDEVKVFRCNHNWKFYGRFAAAMLVDTEYVAMFDDDTIPGKDWLSNCLQTMKVQEGILGGVGCVLPGERYYGHHRIGWSNPNEDIEEVDLVGHAWFFKREWLQYLWREKPQTWDNGEDIQFSYLAQKYGGVRTFVPPHPKDKPEMFSSLKGMEYGVDEVATSNQRNHQVFYTQRDECVRNAVKNGWKLVRSR